MSEARQENRSGCAIVAASGLVLLPLVYLLLIGPVAWLVDHQKMPGWLAEGIYAPVIILAEWSPAFMRILEWYIELWR